VPPSKYALSRVDIGTLRFRREVRRIRVSSMQVSYSPNLLQHEVALAKAATTLHDCFSTTLHYRILRVLSISIGTLSRTKSRRGKDAGTLVGITLTGNHVIVLTMFEL
jgi:hypothetical protein